MRAGCRNLIIGHVLCLLLAFFFISPITALVQVLYIGILVSVSLTLKSLMIYLYMGVAGMNLVSGALSVVTLTDGFIWYAMILFYYFIAIKVMWTESKPYRSGARNQQHGSGNALSENLIQGAVKTFSKHLVSEKKAEILGPQVPL